jgi:hypothetical protein
MWAFIMLFLLRFVAPFSISFILMFQLGLALPDQSPEEMNATFSVASERVADIYVSAYQNLFSAGQEVSQNNPFFGKVVFYGISAGVWTIWLGMIGVILTMLRYPLVWAIEQMTALQSRRRKE